MYVNHYYHLIYSVVYVYDLHMIANIYDDRLVYVLTKCQSHPIPKSHTHNYYAHHYFFQVVSLIYLFNNLIVIQENGIEFTVILNSHVMVLSLHGITLLTVQEVCILMCSGQMVMALLD